MKRILRFLSAIWGSFVWWCQGFDVLARHDESLAREAICVQCPRFNHRHGTCMECGCLVIAKAMLAREKCPLSKWNSIRRRTQIS